MAQNAPKPPSLPSLQNHSDIQTLSMNCKQEHRPPCQSTALAVLPQFSALSAPSGLSLHNDGHVPTDPRTAPEESRRTSAQFALCTCLCEATAPPLCRRTEAEAPPRSRRNPAGTGAAWSQRRPQRPQPPSRRPVFVSRPGLAASCSNRARASRHPKVCTATTARAWPGVVGTSTNCSASCGARSSARCGMGSSGMIVGTSIACSATTGSEAKNLSPPSAAQEHREPVPHAQVRRSAPWCAAEPAPAA